MLHVHALLSSFMNRPATKYNNSLPSKHHEPIGGLHAGCSWLHAIYALHLIGNGYDADDEHRHNTSIMCPTIIGMVQQQLQGAHSP